MRQLGKITIFFFVFLQQCARVVITQTSLKWFYEKQRTLWLLALIYTFCCKSFCNRPETFLHLPKNVLGQSYGNFYFLCSLKTDAFRPYFLLVKCICVKLWFSSLCFMVKNWENGKFLLCGFSNLTIIIAESYWWAQAWKMH